jgi:uncharacterized protein (DUF1778 family)
VTRPTLRVHPEDRRDQRIVLAVSRSERELIELGAAETREYLSEFIRNAAKARALGSRDWVKQLDTKGR